MATPRIGIFGALFALGGVLAWRWTQKQRASQTPAARDITRWESEGGAVTESSRPGSAIAPATHLRGSNGADHSAAGDVWPFPRT